MKFLLPLAVLFAFLHTAPAKATETAGVASRKCVPMAEKIITTKWHNSFYNKKKEQIRWFTWTYCRKLKSQKGHLYVWCDSSANKGDGGADLRFKILLDEKCDRSFVEELVKEKK